MRTSIATVSVAGTLTEKLAAIAQAGFDGVEIFENDLVASPLAPERIRELAAELGLTIDLYQPLRDIEAVPDAERFAANLKRAERKLELMGRLGADTLLVCSNVSPHAVDDDALAAEQLSILADRAAARGIRIAYEALAWGTHVDQYAHSWRIVSMADHPALGVCLDSFHILSRGADPTAIREIPGAKIFFLQLADAPMLAMDVLQWSRHHRCFPGQGDFDLPAFLGHVLAAGYAGPLSLEVFSDTFRQAEPESTAVDAMRSLLYLQDSLAPSPPAETDGLGLAFAELAVPATAAPTFAESLQALGFARVGAHRSKNASLWQHGDARLVVNTETRAELELREPRAPRLTALGLRTEDSKRLADRAEHFRGPVQPRRRGIGEADLPSIRTPAGTTLLFCQDETWLADFDPDDGASAHLIPTHGDTLTGIDHVALATPFDAFDDTVLFLRAVLGLRPGESLDLADPHGLVRSRSLTSAPSHPAADACAHAIRLAVNMPPLGGRGGPGAQHVAFASTDAFATQAAMSAADAPLLEIPDNYYEDLQARFDLDDATVARLRRAAMLYDRDGDRGEFLHFYTAPLGPRLFLEFVQRIGPYNGYGAPNAAIRLAAHAESPRSARPVRKTVSAKP
jgi:4-hydroxyphenylpyruvate dioxygenase